MNHETTLAYLPMIDQPATEPQAVYKCMKVMQLTMQQLDQTPTVIYMDQAMYALGQEVLWANSDHDDMVFMMNFLADIGTIFGKLGWGDLLVDAGIFSAKVVAELLDAKPYTRYVEAQIAMYEVLSSARLTMYSHWLGGNEDKDVDGDLPEISC